MPTKSKGISFHRRYHGYTGGHQKVRDYIDHFLALGWLPSLYVSNKAATNRQLFSEIPGVTYQPDYCVDEQDCVFLAGEDWQAYLAANEQRVQHQIINLIQHVRHAEPGSSLFSYLQYPALRLCVSEAIKNAIEPYANGPCVVIPMGHDLPDIRRPRHYDAFILANKNPELGQQLYQWLEHNKYKVQMYATTVEHDEITSAMASARVTIALPHKTEGFYLPGIEAMWLSDSAVVPYCVANTEYHSRFNNCYLCDYSPEAIKTTTLQALEAPQITTRIRRYFGQRTASRYSKARERAALAQALDHYFYKH